MATRANKWAGTVYENVHPILGGVLRALDTDAVPEPPYHLGGPRPKCGANTVLHVGLATCDRVRHLVNSDHVDDYDSTVHSVRDYVATLGAGQPTGSDADKKLSRGFDERGDLHRNRANPAPIPSMLCVATSNCIWRKTERALDSVRAIAIRAAKALAHDPDELRRYVADLDGWLVVGECRTALFKYEPELATTVTDVLFRADRGNGTAGHFIFRLESGGLGLITKLKGRYKMFHGDRDTLLATLPTEQLMDAATKQLTKSRS